MLHNRWFIVLWREYHFVLRTSRRAISHLDQSKAIACVARTRPITGTLFGSKPIGVLRVHITWLSVATLLHLLTTFRAELKEDSKKMEVDYESILLEADDLFNQNKFSDTFDLLQDQKDSENVEVLWRISRALYNMAREGKNPKHKELIRTGFAIIKRALEIDDANFAVHKWYALLLDEDAQLDGIKARVTQSMNFKKHMLRATELNPKDATSLYSLGAWCFHVAELPWIQRKIAAALFGTPPTSSYDEALIYFLKAEEAEPNFYSLNLLMLGKTYLRVKNMEKAQHYLSITITRPVHTDADLQASKEAKELLKQVKL